MPSRLARLSRPAWLPEAAAALALAVYLLQAWTYTHTNIPGLDEGAYLYKGYLFASGEYRPFENGILTNKAPLAFLIPGYVQVLFGLGLRTGRAYALLAGLLAILGTYGTARPIGSRWLAAASIWVFAVSPMATKIYAGAVSEGLIAAMLAWMLYFVLGDGRRQWQLAVGATLAGLMILTRQNMIPVLPFLTAFLVWEHGWRRSWRPIVLGAAVLLLGHALLWPDILKMWAPWFPAELTPFLDSFRPPTNIEPSWNPSVDWIGRAGAFFEEVRHHLIIVVASISALVLARGRAAWAHLSRFREFIFLCCLYFGLFLLHAWGAVGSRYEFFSCTYCFTPYLGFFAPAGILLGVLSARHSEPAGSPVRSSAAVFFVIVLFAGVAFSAFEDLGSPLLELRIPRFAVGSLASGWTALGDVLRNATGLPMALARKAASLSAGLAGGVTAVLLAYVGWRRPRRAPRGYAAFLLNATLLLSFGLTPLMAGRASRPDCAVDVIALNEEVGYHLSRTIPVGSHIYWDGGLSVVPMLYLPGRAMYAPQINSGYTYVRGGDPQVVLDHGYWNADLRAQWLGEADFVIVEEQRYSGWKATFTPDLYAEYARSPVGTSCLAETRLRVFRRHGS